MNRREFLCATVGAACAAAAIPAAAGERGPRLRVALIGCGPRGAALSDTAIRTGSCEITAAWDADPALAQAAGARHGATAYPTVRDLLASAAPDIAIRTGRVDAAGTLDLLRSGTHLFMDTVPTAALADIQALGKAALSTRSVVQVNLAGSASSGCPEVLALMRGERIGEVRTARAHVHHYHRSAPQTDPAAVLGWASDIQAVIGGKAPRRVTATGHEQDHVITWEFDELTAIWEQRVFPGAAVERVSSGATWYGSRGVLRLEGDSWRLTSHEGAPELRGRISAQDRDAANWAEFLGAVRERRQPSRSLVAALNVSEMVRVAECSLMVERPLLWDGRRRVVVRDAEANRLLCSATEWAA